MNLIRDKLDMQVTDHLKDTKGPWPKYFLNLYIFLKILKAFEFF